MYMAEPVIGEVTPQSIAAQAGIETGMELKSISGIKTADWESVNMGLISHIGDQSMTVTVASQDDIGFEQQMTLDISDWSFNPETESAMTTLGFRPYSPEVSTVLAQIIDDGAAYDAGLEAGDKIVEINGQPIEQWQSVVELIRANPMTPLDLVVLRNGAEQSLVMTPKSRELSDGSTIGYAGIAPEVAEWPEDYRFELQFGVIESVGKAFDKTGQIIGLTLTMLKKSPASDHHRTCTRI